jgi:nucleoid DNA-binding protein
MDYKMNRNELASKISEVVGGTKKDAELYLSAIVDVITDELVNKGEVNISNFGKFSTTEVGEKSGTIRLGERKGESYTTPKHNKPVFKFGKNVKGLVAGE